MERRGKDAQKLIFVVGVLAEKGVLPSRYNVHKLQGEYLGLCECHIESDWLLVYEITEDMVVIYRTGSHTDLFWMMYAKSV